LADSLILLRGGHAIAAGPTREAMSSDNLSTVYRTRIDVYHVNGRLVALSRGPHHFEREVWLPLR